VTQEETDDEAMNTVITEVTEISDPDQTPDMGSKENLQGILGGSELEACDSRGETPIFWAARQGNTEAVRLLAAAGAKIATQNKVSEITHMDFLFLRALSCFPGITSTHYISAGERKNKSPPLPRISWQ
jgi:ankyrin repeat protein